MLPPKSRTAEDYLSSLSGNGHLSPDMILLLPPFGIADMTECPVSDTPLLLPQINSAFEFFNRCPHFSLLTLIKRQCMLSVLITVLFSNQAP
jgi:hypothetical protein